MSLDSCQALLFNKLLSDIKLDICPHPGGCYKGGVWCRDASYILNALAHCGMHDVAKTWAHFIWSNSISEDCKKIVLGRGSPAHGLAQQLPSRSELASFTGALPTTILQDYNEIYAAKPDIDSTALMMYATGVVYQITQDKSFLLRVMPYVEHAMRYLEARDTDGDLLLEQGCNEDWMDVMCRSGKIVYTQATWIQALLSYSYMMSAVGLENNAEDTAKKAMKVARRVNEVMWDERSECYADIIDTNDSDIQMQTVTQDVCLFLSLEGIDSKRRIRSLDTIKSRLSRTSGRAAMDPVVKRQTPIMVGEYCYQNGGFWPWITAIECTALSKAGRIREALDLISQAIPYVDYEWVNPITLVRGGATPFKTGIAAMYLACEHVRTSQSA